MPEHILIAFLAGSEDNKLNIVVAQLIHDVSDQIASLLVCESRNQTDHHLPVILPQRQLLLQSPLILDLLLAEIDRIVGLDNILVRLRVKLRVINAVDDTARFLQEHEIGDYNT